MVGEDGNGAGEGTLGVCFRMSGAVRTSMPMEPPPSSGYRALEMMESYPSVSKTIQIGLIGDFRPGARLGHIVGLGVDNLLGQRVSGGKFRQ
uniref:Uncharacterized protein n=1 Tax=Candidatus Kentrum sp. LFY TaxID=2126342 RepID=A0A450WSZ7_9GAMM|nr:MAG: hypothetical protein BECKLFY1418C_GA0070996_106815 [Candidatus Kentron sp. LFY]